jgi:ADP-heptose:LPS heptosyltransferase
MRIRLPSNEQLLYIANVLADKLLFRQNISSIPQKILIVKWDEIGDMATSTHVFAIVKTQFPESEITVLCKPFVKSLIEYDPHINHIITDIGSYKQKYDLVIELRGTWSTLIKSIWHKAHYRVSRAEVRLKNKGRQLHEIDTNIEILRPMFTDQTFDVSPTLYYSDVDTAKVREFLTGNGIGRFAVIHAGARRKLRQWNPDRFALAAQYLHEQHGLEIIFAGSEQDREDIGLIRSYLHFNTFDFTGGFSLSQFSCLCSMASFYLGNESGPMHIASAFEVPLIGLFGPGVPYVFYPRSKDSAVLHIILSCNPCDQVHCVHPENPCISRIDTTEVLKKIDEILHK